MRSLRQMSLRRKAVVALVSVLAAVFGGQALANAAGSPDDRSPGASVKVVGSTGGASCGFAYDTETSSLTPPDDSTTDNAAAAAATLHKACRGGVLAVFDGEFNGSAPGNFIHMDLRATCTGTGGFTNSCTVGQEVFGQPGHTFLQTGGGVVGTRTAQWIFPNLKKGDYTFEALPGGDGAAFLGFRTLTVTAFNGG